MIQSYLTRATTRNLATLKMEKLAMPRQEISRPRLLLKAPTLHLRETKSSLKRKSLKNRLHLKAQVENLRHLLMALKLYLKLLKNTKMNKFKREQRREEQRPREVLEMALIHLREVLLLQNNRLVHPKMSH